MEAIAATASCIQLLEFAGSLTKTLTQLIKGIKHGPGLFREQEVNVHLLLKLIDRMRTECDSATQQDLFPILEHIKDITTHLLKLLELPSSLIHRAITFTYRKDLISTGFQDLLHTCQILDLQLSWVLRSDCRTHRRFRSGPPERRPKSIQSITESNPMGCCLGKMERGGDNDCSNPGIFASSTMPTQNLESRGTDPPRLSAKDMPHERINSTNDFDISENVLGYNALSYIGNDSTNQSLNTDHTPFQPQTTQMRVARNDFGNYSTFISGNISLDMSKIIEKHRAVQKTDESLSPETKPHHASTTMSGALGSYRSEAETPGRQGLDSVSAFNLSETLPRTVSPSPLLRTRNRHQFLQLVAPTSHPLHTIVTT